jgi:hypothetical protein
VRLYFYFKHYQPHNLRAWLAFGGYELRLLWRDLIRAGRALAAATLKGKFERYPAIGIEFFNLVTARLAIPWLLWRARRYGGPGKLGPAA